MTWYYCLTARPSTANVEHMFEFQDAQLETLTGLEREAGGCTCGSATHCWRCGTTPPRTPGSAGDPTSWPRPRPRCSSTAVRRRPAGHRARAAHDPLLRALLRDGRLLVAHALVTVDELGALGDPDLAARVLGAVLASDGRLGWDGTPAELRRALRRAAIRLDPGTAARRREDAALRSPGCACARCPTVSPRW